MQSRHSESIKKRSSSHFNACLYSHSTCSMFTSLNNDNTFKIWYGVRLLVIFSSLCINLNHLKTSDIDVKSFFFLPHSQISMYIFESTLCCVHGKKIMWIFLWSFIWLWANDRTSTFSDFSSVFLSHFNGAVILAFDTKN